jgi:hypothetical protein
VSPLGPPTGKSCFVFVSVPCVRACEAVCTSHPRGLGPAQNPCPPPLRLLLAPASRLRPGCVPAASRLRPGCVPAASRLRPGCVPAASRLRPACIPAAFRLHPGCNEIRCNEMKLNGNEIK